MWIGQKDDCDGDDESCGHRSILFHGNRWAFVDEGCVWLGGVELSWMRLKFFSSCLFINSSCFGIGSLDEKWKMKNEMRISSSRKLRILVISSNNNLEVFTLFRQSIQRPSIVSLTISTEVNEPPFDPNIKQNFVYTTQETRAPNPTRHAISKRGAL